MNIHTCVVYTTFEKEKTDLNHMYECLYMLYALYVCTFEKEKRKTYTVVCTNIHTHKIVYVFGKKKRKKLKLCV